MGSEETRMPLSRKELTRAQFGRVTCRISPHHFPDVRAALVEMARETFRIRTDGGRVVSSSDEKAIFVAKKPGDSPR